MKLLKRIKVRYYTWLYSRRLKKAAYGMVSRKYANSIIDKIASVQPMADEHVGIYTGGVVTYPSEAMKKCKHDGETEKHRVHDYIKGYGTGTYCSGCHYELNTVWLDDHWNKGRK